MNACMCAHTKQSKTLKMVMDAEKKKEFANHKSQIFLSQR